ncbi:MAG: lysophospholipase, partial [Akkermansiaceae bacterium]|nr:lysophospholipase [Akkermansiaceae bacterium]
GMNDGIYYPFSEERFAKYQAGINTLIEKVAKHGAPLVLLTPPPFDPLPLQKKGKLLPASAPRFSWMQIYEHYDRDVIARYAKWILAQKDRVAEVIDLHGPITAFVQKQRTSK